MHPKQRLEFIIGGKMARAANDYLDNGWSGVQSMTALPPTLFDAWADCVQLPCGSVRREKCSADGIFVLQDAEGWLVFKQEQGIPLPEKRIYANYKEAKRAALAWGFLDVLRDGREK